MYFFMYPSSDSRHDNGSTSSLALSASISDGIEYFYRRLELAVPGKARNEFWL